MVFSAKFISWIMTCVTTVSYSLLLNGRLTKTLHANTGLRQGYLMLPYLFVLAIEYLDRELQQLTKNGNFNFHPRCRKLETIHVCFDDDLLIYYWADLISITLLNEDFMKFARASRLHANADKSSFYLAGVDAHTKHKLLEELGYTEGTMVFRYLGVLLTSKNLIVN
ncbi:uncharacterized protein LOC125834199 [Solanum verrucosum]|uniref:uncharacterized protein LOC125834199 n=1 Tax=Solanum verrucosum TaxID=315347 RepID=UPI0020D0DD67|nr:uncharacterized protein LOC125834199 [Solanum verrucosum]